MPIKPGQVVRSLAGHDAGGYFMVVACEADRVSLADGKRRPLQKPKQKNLRHIRKTNRVLELGSIDTNQKLRRALAAIRASEEE